MQVRIINWDKTPKGNDTELLNLYYSFMKVSELIIGGTTIEELRLQGNKEEQVSEAGFREWLKGFVSVEWKEGELSKEQIMALNEITNYLKSSHKQEEQPINKGGISLAGLIKKHRK